MCLVLSACASGDDTGTDETTTTSADTSTTGSPSTTTTSEAGDTTTSESMEMDGIHTADTGLGSILVDEEGFTLYVFTNDTAGESTCYDACADLWPPVPADSEIGSGLDAALFGSTARTDGSEQLTIDGRPLYRYAPDTSPGDTTGQGFSGVWFVVDAAGQMISGATSSRETTTTSDYGYDY